MGNLLYNSEGNLKFMFILFISYLLYAPLTIADDARTPWIAKRSTCTGASYTPDSTFSTNLKALFSSLNSQSARSICNSSTTGSGADKVYGLYLCQGDLSFPICQSYLQNAISNITSSCPTRQGIIWYDYIMLRYSDTNFFGVEDSSGFSMPRPDKQTISTEPYRMVSELIRQAPDTPSYFAFNASAEDTRYAMAQCTVDLSKDGCSTCLKTILGNISDCCTKSDGWRFLAHSCWIRYEITPFLQSSIVIPATPFSPSPQAEEQNRGNNKKTKIAAIVVPILVLVVGGCIIFFIWKTRKQRKDVQGGASKEFRKLRGKDLLFMDLATIHAATSKFSDANLLGEGGFGPVYKGVLPDAREIAIKRMAKRSSQGAPEFKNEVRLIAKLQHRNLVRILGCCIEREERMIIYEYLANKGLDSFLFEDNKRSQLDWKTRLHIIEGITKGLLYLHEDSLPKVIHRDLKASNVLLDNDMNPKISDFGMAKIFEENDSRANTSRVVGTLGYMAPEYAIDGIFSVKADVYSFGVIVLEILSGQKNGRTHYEQHGKNLLVYAWELWNDDKAMDFMDPMLVGTYSENEAMRFILIGLLCVQEDADERPTMSTIFKMLSNYQMELPQPIKPPNFIRQRIRSDSSASNARTASVYSDSINEVTISDMQAR